MDPLTFDLGENPVPACGNTRLSLRRFHAGELPSEQQASLQAHVDSCIDCQAVIEELRSDDAAFRTHIPFARFQADHAKRVEASQPVKAGLSALWKYLAGGGVAAVLAVGAASVLMVPATVLKPEEEVGERIKGKAVGLGFLVKTADGVRAGRPGEQLREGDQIHFMVKSPAAAQHTLVVLGVDGKGAVSVYHSGPPPAGDVGGVAPLPESIVLDDAVGNERFFAVVGSGSAEELRKQAEAAAARLAGTPDQLPRVDALDLPDGAQQDSVLIMKVRR